MWDSARVKSTRGCVDFHHVFAQESPCRPRRASFIFKFGFNSRPPDVAAAQERKRPAIRSRHKVRFQIKCVVQSVASVLQDLVDEGNCTEKKTRSL